MPRYKSVVILTPNARRQTVKVTPNTTLLKVLEEASAKQGYNPKEFDLKHHNKIMDLDNVIRFTGLPSNALLEMVPAVKVRQDSEVFLGVQVEAGERFTGTFMPSDSLWTLLCKLCPVEVSKDGNPVAIYMHTEVSGREKLEKTTLHSLGITGGRAMLRFMHQSPEELRVQANVSAPLVRPTPKTKIESLAVSSEETESKNKQSSSPKANQLEVTLIKDEEIILSLSESEEFEDRSPLHNEKLVCKHTEGDVSEPMEDSSSSKEECSSQSCEVKQGKETKFEASTVYKEEPMDVTDSEKHESDSNKSESVLYPKDVPELVTEEEDKFLPGDHNGSVISLNESQKMSADNFAEDLHDGFYEVTIEDPRVVMRDLKKRSFRETKISPEQYEILLNYMEEHPDFATGRQHGPSSKCSAKAMWEELAARLNADGSGPSKLPYKWQKTWVDWKSYTKKKYLKIRRSQQGPGGGPSKSISLNNLEERLLAFLGPIEMFGDMSLPEAGLPSEPNVVEEVHLFPPEEVIPVKVDDASPARPATKRKSGEDLVTAFIGIEEKRLKMEDERQDIERRKAKGVEDLARAMESIASTCDGLLKFLINKFEK